MTRKESYRKAIKHGNEAKFVNAVIITWSFMSLKLRFKADLLSFNLSFFFKFVNLTNLAHCRYFQERRRKRFGGVSFFTTRC